MTVRAKTRLLARLLGVRASVIHIDDRRVTTRARGATREYPHEQITGVRVVPSFLWSHVAISTAAGKQWLGRGLRDEDAARVVGAAALWGTRSRVSELLQEFDRPGGRHQYLTQSRFAEWAAMAKPVCGMLPKSYGGLEAPTEIINAASRLAALSAKGEAARTARNLAYVEEQAVRHAEFFRSGQGYPLNEDQVSAILHDEDRSLVVAGAGTGKTSTIVGKAAYLLREKLATPGELLLLAFTRKAAEEMEDRLKRLTGETVAVRTFHSLGLQAIAQAAGKKPTLSKLAEDEKALRAALHGYLTAMIAASPKSPAVEFLAYHKYPYHEPASFRTEHEYIQHIRGHDVRSLKGERLKSVEESMIANWLLLHGVEYEYERPYEHDTASIQYRQYKPDFYLPQHQIYIEHFGINSRGKPPPFIRDGAAYLKSMAWKQQLHRSHGTRLVETYSHQASAGTLLKGLEESLRGLGVKFGPPDPKRIAELLEQEEILNPFVGLLGSFLNLYKGNAWTPAEVRDRVATTKDHRTALFLQVFEAVAADYERALAKERAIDFSDMINVAVDHAASGRYSPGFRYVLVDEFQDISRGRARLIHALLAQVPGSRLFCVGDDWQAIYRFAGNDVDLMTRFPEHFGPTRRTDLRQTHRFNDKLLRASSSFVTANPQQLRKDLVAARQSDVPAVRVVSAVLAKDRIKQIEETLAEIWREAGGEPITVLLLGRYHFVLDAYRVVKPPDPKMGLELASVHQAKGREADYVVVLDVVNGRYGFPTEITDDPLLDLVLAGRSPFPHAEERRLFYVALTRARARTYLLTDDVDRSVFVDEMEAAPYAGLVIPSGARARTVACPTCRGGTLVRREGEFGVFWGCSNFPHCITKARTCPWCGVGAFVPRSFEYRCANNECGMVAQTCPKCGIGAVVPRTGRYGEFRGCTEWRSKGPSCTYTRS